VSIPDTARCRAATTPGVAHSFACATCAVRPSWR
jgi:hypothetical protein